jgi:hypothetical protein
MFKITPTYFDHQMIIIRELSDPGYNHWLKCESSSVVMQQHTVIHFGCCAERHVDMLGVRDGVVVKALHYKPAGCGFNSQWCHWNFSVA